MPFPQIHTCIVCELTRPEEGGKLTILGFHGIAPDVRIQLQGETRNLEFLTFILISPRGEGEGQFQVAARILAPNGQDNWVGPNIRAELLPNPEAKLTMAIQAGNAVFPIPGRYTLQVLVDGAVHYNTTFSIMN